MGSNPRDGGFKAAPKSESYLKKGSNGTVLMEEGYNGGRSWHLEDEKTFATAMLPRFRPPRALVFQLLPSPSLLRQHRPRF